jgi:hypothetical protein
MIIENGAVDGRRVTSATEIFGENLSTYSLVHNKSQMT